jgi:hypothetical protein
MLDIVLPALGYGVLLPGAVTLAVLVLVLRRDLARPGGDLLAVAAGLVAGFTALALTGQITWGFLRPDESWDWLPGLTLVACFVGIVERRLLSAPGKQSVSLAAARWALRLAVGAAAAWLLVGTQAKLEPVPGWWYAVLTLVIAGLWGLERLARDWPGAGLPVLLALVVVAAAAVVELVGFGTLAQTMGVLAAVCGACAVAGWLWPRAPVAAGTVPAFAVLLPGLLFVTYFRTYSYSDVPAASYLLVLAAPLLLAVTLLPPLGRLSRGWLALLRTAAVLALLAVAVALAAAA